MARSLKGWRLRFEQGRVVEAKATKYQAFLQKMLDADPGARYLGEWALGTNENGTFSKTFFSMKKWTARCTWQWGRDTRKPARATNPPSIGT